MPAQGVLIEQRPEKPEAEWEGGEQSGEDAVAHGGVGGILVGEGAEADAGVAHAGRGVGQSEKEHLVEQSEHDEGTGRPGDGGVARDFVKGVLSGEMGESKGEHGGEGGLHGEDERDVDGGGCEATADGRGLWDVDGEVVGGRGTCEIRRGESGEQDGGPLGGEGLGCGSGGDLAGLYLKDAQLGRGGGVRVVVAEGAFGDSRPGLASGDELARELDEVGGDGFLRRRFFEDGVVAEGDLILEREALVLIDLPAELIDVDARLWGGGSRGGGRVDCVGVGPDGETDCGRGRGCRRHSFVGAEAGRGGLLVEESGVVDGRERDMG